MISIAPARSRGGKPFPLWRQVGSRSVAPAQATTGRVPTGNRSLSVGLKLLSERTNHARQAHHPSACKGAVPRTDKLPSRRNRLASAATWPASSSSTSPTSPARSASRRWPRTSLKRSLRAKSRTACRYGAYGGTRPFCGKNNVRHLCPMIRIGDCFPDGADPQDPLPPRNGRAMLSCRGVRHEYSEGLTVLHRPQRQSWWQARTDEGTPEACGVPGGGVCYGVWCSGSGAGDGVASRHRKVLGAISAPLDRAHARTRRQSRHSRGWRLCQYLWKFSEGILT